MKQTVSSLVAGTAGAVVTLALVVGQPALAEQATKARAKVTSAMIKDGTIQRKDLNRQVKTSLTKAGTALQQVPDDSVTTGQLAGSAVTGSKVADGSLTASDLAAATGTLPLDFPSMTTNTCVPSGPIGTGHVVTGDLILVSAPGTVVGSVQVFAREDAADSTAINIVACNNGATFNPPQADFHWAVIAS